ncbi:MAG: hypothetical protein ACRYGK_09825 [Janthinobacterium lividum]
MAAVTYTKADWKAEADIERLADGKFQGVVLRTSLSDPSYDAMPQRVSVVSDTPEEALEEAQALAHKILAALPPVT